MLYIIGLFVTIIKGVLFIVGKDLLPYLSERNFSFMFGMIIINIALNKLYKYKKRHNNLTDHIIYYRFNNKKSLYYSLFIVAIAFISYIIIIISLRVANLEKPIDLIQIYLTFSTLYDKTSLFLCFYIIVIILLIFYALLKIVLLIRKYLNVHVAKIHFYLLSFQQYKDIHNYIRDNLDAGSVVSSLLRKIIHDVEIIFCFGYYKDTCYKHLSDMIIDKTDKTSFWTNEDILKHEIFQKKYQLIIISFYYLIEIIRKSFYMLDLIVLFIIITYDIFYHDYVLITTTHILPFLFIFRIYISLCNFITDKPTYDICELINDFYYQDLAVLDEKTIMLNGKISEMPKNFVRDFLMYEAKGFYRKRN